MTALAERERSVLPQRNGGVEAQPQPDSVNPEVVVFQERKAKRGRAEIVRKKANLVAEAWQNGWDQFLTEKQRLAVGRYLEVGDNGRIPSLEAWRIRLKDNGLIDISRQGVLVDEKSGLSKFRKIRSEKEREEKGQQEEDIGPVIKNLYEVEGWTPYRIARRLRIPRETVCQIIQQADDIQRREKGRPRTRITIYDPDLIEFNLKYLRDRGLINKGIGDKMTWTPEAVEVRLRRSNGGNLVSQENH